MLERVFRMQRRAARIILGIEKRTRAIIMLTYHISFFVLIYISIIVDARLLIRLAPAYIRTIHKTNSNIRSRSTRFSNLNFSTIKRGDAHSVLEQSSTGMNSY